MNAAVMPPTNNNNNSGVAGRTNYAQWDRVVTDLEKEALAEEEEERQREKAAVGLDGKYARSQAEADERKKLKQVKKTKKQLETFQKREQAIVQTFAGLLGPPVATTATKTDKDRPKEEEKTTASTTTPTKIVERITRDRLEAGKRVVTICDTSGRSKDDTIVLTADLNHLESKLSTNASAKSFEGDAENSAPTTTTTTTQPRAVFGLIKVFMANLQHCTVLIKCKIISGTLELHNCRDVTVRVASTGTVATVQADMSQDIQLEFHDAPSGQNTADPDGNNDNNNNNRLYWGDSPNDRIFHAGVSNLSVSIFRDGLLETSCVADYLKDGATAVGNATPQEFQFVTSCVGDDNDKNDNDNNTTRGQLRTEAVVRAGATTGTNARAMTARELQAEEERRRQAEKMAIAMAESMVQIKDKDGNVLVEKNKESSSTSSTSSPVVETVADETVQEEVVTDSVKDIVKECEQNKARGNEAFGAGEYGQAILLYTLALDKADELPSSSDHKLFPRDILLSNRAACFLKLGQHEKAEEDASRALQINPANVKATFRKGLALHAAGRYYDAMPVLAAAHKMEPKNKQIKQALQFCEVRVQQDQRKRMAG